MMDDEAEERFPEGAAPRLVLLQHGDHPVVEPGELWLRVILGKEYAMSLDPWFHEHGDRLEEFRADRLPEVKGLVTAIDDPDASHERNVGIMKIDGISLIDPEEHEFAAGFTPLMGAFGRVDLETLDALITAGIVSNRGEAIRWALARIRERPAYRELSERACEPEAAMERTAMGRIQRMINDEMAKRFPEGSVPRVVLLQYGDDPVVEPGKLWVRVLIGTEYEESMKEWVGEHAESLQECLAEMLPQLRRFEITIDDPEIIDTHQPPGAMLRIPGSPADPGEDDPVGMLTSLFARLGPADLETLDTLITAGIAANRAEGVRWALARIRERPAYGKLSERARDLEELKAQF
jgi:Arc/MetJ-type ribon-helix-helix transcriptional regulator